MCSDTRVTYFQNETNIGPIANFQHALGKIETEYFVPLADDDWLLPDFIYEAYQILEDDEELAAAVFVTEMQDETGRLLRTYPDNLDKLRFGKLWPREHLRDWMSYSHYGWSSILWRRKVLQHIGPPYLHVGLPSDVDFQAQIFSQYPVYLVNKPGAVYLTHAAQGSHSMNMTQLGNWARLFRRLDRRILENHLFESAEHLALRSNGQSQYQTVWRDPVPNIDRNTLIRFAAEAGVVLNDWELAIRLASQIPKVEDSSAYSLFFLPKLSDSDPNPEPARGRSAFKLAALKWILSARERTASLKQEVEHSQSVIEELQAEIRHKAAQIETLRQELDGLNRHFAMLEAAHNNMNNYLLSLAGARIFRGLLRLGLLPPPRPPGS